MNFIKRWIVSDVSKKVIASAVKLVVSFATAHGIILIASYNVYVCNVQDQAGLTVLFNSGLKAAEHYLSQKYPVLEFLNTVDDVPAPASVVPPANPPA